MSGDTRLQIYTDEELNEKIERRADSADLSKSGYCELILKNHHGIDLDGRLSRYSTDKDLISTIDKATSEVTTAIEELQQDTATDLEHHQSLRTMYVLALWELLKQEYSPSEREEAIKQAAIQMADGKSSQSPSTTNDDAESDLSSPLEALLASDA